MHTAAQVSLVRKGCIVGIYVSNKSCLNGRLLDLELDPAFFSLCFYVDLLGIIFIFSYQNQLGPHNTTGRELYIAIENSRAVTLLGNIY